MANSYLEHLSQVSLFHALSEKELHAIAKSVDEISIEAGRVLAEQGRAGHEAFVVVDGVASVTINDEKVAQVGPGELVGTLSLLDGGPRTATVTAMSPMTVLAIPQQSFLGLIEDIPGFARKVMTNLAQIIRNLDSSI